MLHPALGSITQPKHTIVQLTQDRCSNLCCPAACSGTDFLQFSFDICQCSEIYFKHQLTLSGFPGGIFADKIGWLAHHPWMSGGNQSQGRWLTQGSVPWSSHNNNRVWEGIQSESGLMILIQPATSDKAPVLSTASSAPHCNSLLSTDSKMELIVLHQFNATVILIMLFQSSPFPVLTMSLIFSMLCNCSTVHRRGNALKCRLNQNKCTNFALSSWVWTFGKPTLFPSLAGILQTAIYTYIMNELLHQIKSRASCNELWGYSQSLMRPISDE